MTVSSSRVAAPDVRPGDTRQLGSRPSTSGVDFCLLARGASRVDLLLFDRVDGPQPQRLIELQPQHHRTRDYWHVHVAGISPGQLYGYRVHRDEEAPASDRADSDKVLLDPYARAIALPDGPYRRAASQPGRNDMLAPKSVVCRDDDFDWQDDELPLVPAERTVIYELHVGLFTGHPNSGVSPERRGTYLGVVDKIDYLLELGVTTVELMPCFQFDVQQAPRDRQNVWGYDPMSFFAPHLGYASRPDPQLARTEFRTMVRELHKAGLEVVLDVVYNHTAEGPITGPTYCWRGLANSRYYTLDPETGKYADFTGCGNTIQANEAVTRRMIVDSLRYWVEHMHVDGFRFDLASVLSRGRGGVVLDNPPILWDIETEPALARTKLYAEAWDAVGLYQLGDFEGDFWGQWNGKFRDDVRAFFRRDEGAAARVVQRLVGSPDLFADDGREPECSVNFVTCHDGFSLNDVVSYSRKHNHANGEENRDGDSHEICWNLGHEGPSDDPLLEERRNRLVKSMLTINLLALGTPMLAMGDELRRTQHGNNNPWCLGDARMQLDWDLESRHADVRRLVAELIRLRQSLPLFQTRKVRDLERLLNTLDVRWHGLKLDTPDWQPHSHTLAYGLEAGGVQLHVILNAWIEPLQFELPRADSLHGSWHRLVDTARRAPDDVSPYINAPMCSDRDYVAQSESVVVLARDSRVAIDC